MRSRCTCNGCSCGGSDSGDQRPVMVRRRGRRACMWRFRCRTGRLPVVIVNFVVVDVVVVVVVVVVVATKSNGGLVRLKERHRCRWSRRWSRVVRVDHRRQRRRSRVHRRRPRTTDIATTVSCGAVRDGDNGL